MSANRDPIFSNAPGGQAPAAILTGANTATDGSGSNVQLIHTAGADGSFIESLRIKPVGSNVGTLLRVFVNNGSALGPTTTFLWDEMGLPSSAISTTLPMPVFDMPLDMPLPAGWRIYATIATAVAAGIAVIAMKAGQY